MRAIALAVGVGVLGSLAAAPASFAAGGGPRPPAVGTNCQPDGKISGAGSTFQTNAFNNALTYGYQQDVCGPVGQATNLNSAYSSSDPSIFTATLKQGSSTQSTASVSGMVAYNYSLPNGGTAAANGSGAGLKRISCRTDLFAGTDLPYASTDLININGSPGAEASGGNCQTDSKLNFATVPPPFNTAAGSSYPNTSDAVASAMNFPIAGGAVAVAVNLNGMCTAGTPTGINLTSDEFDKIWQGTINQWNDPELVATNPILSTDSCSGNIQRVVRYDNSGTTGLMMQDLGGGNNGTAGIDTGTLCDGSTWLSLFQKNPNTVWPSGSSCVDGSGNVAPAVTTAGANGSGKLITKLEATNGGIGYAELGLWGSLPAGVSFAGLESASATTSAGLSQTNPPAGSFISPGNPGASSACNVGALGLPGSGANGAVGLGGANANWASDNTPATNKENITYTGSQYPVCGLTFDFVYKGDDNESGEPAPVTGASTTVAGPEIGTTNDQLRTLYSFFTYVLSPLGQANLDQATYDELPAAWLSTLRSGYQNNF